MSDRGVRAHSLMASRYGLVDDESRSRPTGPISRRRHDAAVAKRRKKLQELVFANTKKPTRLEVSTKKQMARRKPKKRATWKQVLEME